MEELFGTEGMRVRQINERILQRRSWNFRRKCSQALKLRMNCFLGRIYFRSGEFEEGIACIYIDDFPHIKKTEKVRLSL
jgi:hypothetical protein